MDDEPHPSGEDRYALYAVRFEKGKEVRKRVCTTSRDGLGLALTTMIEEDEIRRGDSVGILDRETRQWLINPWVTTHTTTEDK